MKKQRNFKKVLIVLILIIFVIGLMPINTKAQEEIDTAHIYSKGVTDWLLTWNGIKIHTYIGVFDNNGKEYPAYCLNRDLAGIELGAQDVDIDGLVNNVMVYRAIINGYPYKSISELGCNSEAEAYLATKQAVYCMLTNRDVNEYQAIGESGERTLNALKNIVNAARSSSTTKISSELKIDQIDSLWRIDDIDNKYMSQEFKVKANASIDKYKVELSNSQLEGIMITDENNNEKNEFKKSEKFKILIPITNVTKDGNFDINVSGKVATKPVLYGKSRSSSLQNYALAGFTYEDGKGSRTIYYTKNETKIVIIKKDETGEKFLEGVEFSLLDSNKNEVYTGLTTNSEGKITVKNLLPGKYYIKETRTINGYELYEKLIEVNLKLNETSTINVINNKEVPEIKVEKPVSENTYKEEKSEVVIKLPKTGM